MKKVLTATLLLCISNCYGQYKYGLEVDQHDVRIEGNIDIINSNSTTSFAIGHMAGTELNSHAFGNTILGHKSGNCLLYTSPSPRDS